MITDFDDIQTEFVKKIILRSIIEGYNSYEEILDYCYGIFPDTLNYYIKELLNEGYIVPYNDGYTLSNDDIKLIIYKNKNLNLNSLPNPHPKDFDWRFNKKTINYLTNILLNKVSEKDTILLLGTPSVANNFLEYNSIPKTILIDANKIMIDHFNNKTNKISVIKKDLLYEDINEEINPHKVFFDPPWYIEYYIAFLLQICKITEIGSKVYFVLPQINTRDNEYSNRWNILETSRKLGFSINYIMNKKIEYETPKFEIKIIEKNKIIKQDWRKADLVCLIKYKKTSDRQIKKMKEILESYIKNDEEVWEEFYLNELKILIKGPFQDYTDKPSITSVDDTQYLLSVSRSYPKRKEIDLWLSDNRAFKLTGKSSFLHALLILSNKSIPNEIKVNTQRSVFESLKALQSLF